MYRDIEDVELKKEIINEIVNRLKSKGISEIKFRWAEFVAKKV